MKRIAQFAVSFTLAALIPLLPGTIHQSSASSLPSLTRAKPYAGQTISVAVAFNSPPAALLRQFKAQTGITVKWSNYDWDALQTKITSAMTAHVYFADLTDVDWSRVGTYYRVKWFVPLNRYFPTSSLKGDVPQLNAFLDHGQLIGMPSDSSFMVTTINTKDFKRAGVKSMPKTIAQYEADLKTVQRHHVSAHPLGVPFAAAEGLSTYWYETTGAFGGRVLSNTFAPLFTSPKSPGYKALNWMISAYKSGLVPRQNINMPDSDEMQNEMAHNRVASLFSDYSGQVGTIYDVPGSSTVVHQVQYAGTPGVSGPGANLDNPDGIGIPTTAKHVGAAVEFLRWFDSTTNQARWAGLAGSKDVIVGFPLPMRLSSLRLLARSHKVAQAQTLISLLQHRSRPVFPGGPPPWYPQFSAAVNTNIHSAALGSESVSQAIKAIADTVQQLRSSS